MKIRRNIILVAAAASMFVLGFAGAQTQTFSFTIPAVDVISASGAVSIDLAAPAAGAVITKGSDATSTVSFTSNNETLRNITVSLDSAMPAGTELVLKPSGGTRTTDNLSFTGGTAPTFVTSVTMSTTAARLVTGSTTTGGFKEVAYTGVTLTYELTASLDAAPQTTSASRTVTFSIIAN